MPRDIYFQKPVGPRFPLMQAGQGRVAPPVSGPGLSSLGATIGGQGQYRIAFKGVGIRDFLAGWTMMSFRWASDNIIVCKKLKIDWTCTTAFTTAQVIDLGVYVARQWIAPDQGGTVQPAPTELDNLVAPSEMLAGGIRMAGVTHVSAGVRTLDDQPIFQVLGWATAGSTSSAKMEMSLGNTLASYPLVLRTNEGIVVNLLTTMAAAGVISINCELEWDETILGKN